jgi:hypothetical protein
MNSFIRKWKSGNMRKARPFESFAKKRFRAGETRQTGTDAGESLDAAPVTVVRLHLATRGLEATVAVKAPDA